MKKIPGDPKAGPAGASKRPRGRPRSFDREAALAAAMDVFWEKGFEATSITDLTRAMDINPPSLYAAFGDKEKLFLEAVQRYARTRGESCPYYAEPTAREAIEKLLTYMAEELTANSHPRGCLIMMAAATSANASEAMQKLLAQQRSASREMLRNRIKQGIQEGDVPAGTDASALADFYATILTGMSLQARDGTSRKSLLATVAQAMAVFPAVVSSRRTKEKAAA